MDEAALLRFLLDVSRRGLCAGRSAVKVQEADHSNNYRPLSEAYGGFTTTTSAESLRRKGGRVP